MMRKDDNLLMAAGVPVAFRDKIKLTYPTGSSYTCDPPVTDTDIDFYVLMRVQTLPAIKKHGKLSAGETST